MQLLSKQNITHNGILFNEVLGPKLLNIPLASCFLINLDFLLPNIAHFDNSIVLSLLVNSWIYILCIFFTL